MVYDFEALWEASYGYGSGKSVGDFVGGDCCWNRRSWRAGESADSRRDCGLGARTCARPFANDAVEYECEVGGDLRTAERDGGTVRQPISPGSGAGLQRPRKNAVGAEAGRGFDLLDDCRPSKIH